MRYRISFRSCPPTRFVFEERKKKLFHFNAAIVLVALPNPFLISIRRRPQQQQNTTISVPANSHHRISHIAFMYLISSDCFRLSYPLLLVRLCQRNERMFADVIFIACGWDRMGFKRCISIFCGIVPGLNPIWYSMLSCMLRTHGVELATLFY